MTQFPPSQLLYAAFFGRGDAKFHEYWSRLCARIHKLAIGASTLGTDKEGGASAFVRK